MIDAEPPLAGLALADPAQAALPPQHRLVVLKRDSVFGLEMILAVALAGPGSILFAIFGIRCPPLASLSIDLFLMDRSVFADCIRVFLVDNPILPIPLLFQVTAAGQAAWRCFSSRYFRPGAVLLRLLLLLLSILLLRLVRLSRLFLLLRATDQLLQSCRPRRIARRRKCATATRKQRRARWDDVRDVAAAGAAKGARERAAARPFERPRECRTGSSARPRAPGAKPVRP